MALTTCPECNKEISTEAVSCIHCGKPLNKKIQTIELTSKRWKKVKLIAWIGLVIGFFIFTSNLSNGGFNNPYTGFGFTVGFLSFIVLLIGRFGAWWTNK